ncbi:MAG: hypothetical protein R3F37_12795 [Candidatus Competibacteraceae bacterium]
MRLRGKVFGGLLALACGLAVAMPARAATGLEYECPALEAAENALMSLTQGKDGWLPHQCRSEG